MTSGAPVKRLLLSVIALAALVATGVLGVYIGRRTLSAPAPTPAVSFPGADLVAMQRERDWYRYFYSYYASMERYRQSGHVDQRSGVYAGALPEFYEIGDIAEEALCPAPSDSLVTGGPIYFGSRVTFLKQAEGGHLIYSMSYLGSAEWIHGDPPFDAFWNVDAGPAELEAAENAGLAAAVKAEHGSAAFNHGDTGYFAPISFNVADANGDGSEDFWLGGRLVASGPQGYSLADDKALAGAEVSFITIGGKVWGLVARGDKIEVVDPMSPTTTIGSIHIKKPLATDRSFTVMPVAGQPMFIAVTGDGIDVYLVGHDWSATLLRSLSGFQSGELFAGAFGDFTDDGAVDYWLSESRWKNSDGETVGRLLLMDGASAASGDVAEVAVTTIEGSTRYSDYDGISATLSPSAGDIDSDGRPDLSFTGHRHMSEAGALFVFPGHALRAGRLSVTDPAVIKIVGRPVSQLAPYYNHLDLPGRIIVAADNDLCSGLNAGAIYDVRIPGKPKPTTH